MPARSSQLSARPTRGMVAGPQGNSPKESERGLSLIAPDCDAAIPIMPRTCRICSARPAQFKLHLHVHPASRKPGQPIATSSGHCQYLHFVTGCGSLGDGHPYTHLSCAPAYGRAANRLRKCAALQAQKGAISARGGEPDGVERACVSGLELGQRNPTVLTLWHAAQALGVEVHLLLKIQSNITPQDNVIDASSAICTQRHFR